MLSADSQAAAPAGSAPDPAVLDGLERAGLLRLPARVLNVLSGPLQSRWSLADDNGAHVWVDVPSAPLTTVPGSDPTSRPPVPLAAGPVHGPQVVAGEEVRLCAGPGRLLGRAYRLPWPGRLLAEQLTTTMAVGATAPDLDRAEADLAATARYLRGLHALGAAELPAPGQAGTMLPGPVRRVAGRVPPDAPAGDPSLRVRLQAALDPTPEAGRALLHGEPSTGQLVVPEAPVGSPEPVAVLLGWTGAVAGPPALDIGHLLGDLLELAVFSGGGSGRGVRLLQLAEAVRTAYDDDRPCDPAFWRLAAQAAAVKVLDHDLRLRAVGMPPGHLLADVATAILDAHGRLGAVFGARSPR